ETVLVQHPSVVEGAAVGIPDALKGEALWCFVVLKPTVEPTDQLRQEIKDLVSDALGKSFAPSVVRFTDALPKTRNAKVSRRSVHRPARVRVAMRGARPRAPTRYWIRLRNVLRPRAGR